MSRFANKSSAVAIIPIVQSYSFSEQWDSPLVIIHQTGLLNSISSVLAGT